MASGIASQSVARLLIQTGRRLDELTVADLDELAAACRARQDRTGRGWRHYRGAIHAARQVLFHLGVARHPPRPASRRGAVRAADGRGRRAAARRRSSPTWNARAHLQTQDRVAAWPPGWPHFGRFLAETDPDLASLAELDRRRHIEPFLTSLTSAISTITGEPITVADQARRVQAVASFLADITEWGWPDAPARRLLFRSDLPRLPQPLPRYLPVDADRRLTEALRRLATTGSPPTRCCCNAPAGCASASCSISNSTACTRSPGTAPG